MTAIRNGNLSAAAKVEAGIRDFVRRNDVAHLRRSVPSMRSDAEAALEPNTEATS